jgi:DNA-binding GntR family transcriptional regulator
MVFPAPPIFDETSLTERAYKELEELVVTLRLKPGQVLSESVLVKHLEIGRTPIREALQQLAREGLVSILPRKGVIVSEINVQSQLELLKVRREVERLMVRLAAARTTDPERENFWELSEAMKAAGDAADGMTFIRLDKEFDTAVAVCCRNDVARRTMGLMQGLSRRFWYMYYEQARNLERSAYLHASVAEAISSGDEEASAKASDALIDYIENFTRAALDGPASARK